MTAGDLKNELEYLMEDGSITEGTEIRMAQQPQWAFEYDIKDCLSVVTNSKTSEPIVYLEEGTQLGYLPEDVREEIGW